MCTKIGVDPLASNKGFWADILGVGAFYSELGIQSIDICLRTRPENGGLIELHVLIQKLEEMRGTNAQRISGDDVKLAISKLSQLGNGFSLVQIGAQKMVVSVPLELSRDHTELLQLAREIGGYVSLPLCSARLRWREERTNRALKELLREGMVWVDKQAENVELYWFASCMDL